jgi:hypothetical protein
MTLCSLRYLSSVVQQGRAKDGCTKRLLGGGEMNLNVKKSLFSNMEWAF